MRRLFVWYAMWLACPCLVGAEDAVLADLVRQLDHADFNIREAASASLQQQGVDGTRAIASHIEELSAEGTLRAVQILGTTFRTADTPTSADDESLPAEFTAAQELAGDVLELLRVSTQPLVRRHVSLQLAKAGPLREAIAITRLTALGAKVRREDAELQMLRRGLRQNMPATPQITAVVLTSRWSGGDDGLKYLLRLPYLQAVYRLESTPVTPKALLALRTQMANLTLHVRGGRLGIRSNGGFGEGCTVGNIEDNSPAERAGFKPNDQIVRCDDEPIATFDGLIQFLRTKSPGDTIEVSILRGGRPMSLSVELDDW